MANIVLYLLAAIGAATVLIAGREAINFISLHFIPPPKPLQAYQRRAATTPSYALITGASAGIGLGVAQELARHGFGVILLGHRAAQLDEAKTAIEQRTPGALVRLVVMDATTATPSELQRMVASISDLDVSILVNNVGGSAVSLPAFRTLDTYAAADVDVVIDQNARFMARLTALMLPLLAGGGGGGAGPRAAGEKSLILNMSSQGMAGVPWIVMYGATKAFNHGFSIGLARELEQSPDTRHVDCLAVIPGDVLSEGNCRGVTESAPPADYFGKRIVYSVDAAVRQGRRAVLPYWKHDLEWRLMNWVSEDILSKETAKVIRLKMDAWNQYHEKTA